MYDPANFLYDLFDFFKTFLTAPLLLWNLQETVQKMQDTIDVMGEEEGWMVDRILELQKCVEQLESTQGKRA